MSADSASLKLTHHFLIAMPGLEDDLFSRSVVYLCEYSERGAMGLIINKPADLTMRQLFDKVDLPLRREDLAESPVLQGGPVHTERGFVLHDPIHMPEPEQDGGSIYGSTLTVEGGLEMTTSRDVLEALSSGAGPRRVLVTLGYASWGEGQLESELVENAWLTVPASTDIVFDTPLEQRYDKALDLLGLKPWMLSPEAGHA
jgi:putative transcriptional regulator